MKHQWPMVPLGDLLSRSNEWVRVEPDKRYRQLTVRLWGKGVVLRGEVDGSQIAAERQFVARSQQLILSRIDARHGAIGLVPEALDASIVSSDFPLFNLNADCLLPAFLEWMTKTRSFIALCKAASEGTTNRVRLQEGRFLQLTISLPPLAEQKRIVARIEELSCRIKEAKSLHSRAVEQTEALKDSYISAFLQDGATNPRWEHAPLSTFADINPTRRGKVDLSPHLLVSFVPMTAVDEVTGTINAAQVRPFAEVAKGYTWFQDGDVLFARITPCMQNGKAVLAEGLCNGVGFGSTEFHVLRPHTNRLTGRWLHMLVRHKPFRDDAAAHFKGTAGQQRVPQTFFEQRIIPVPPLAEQQRIIACLDEFQLKLDNLRKLQSAACLELNVLSSAGLDAAFRGEL